MSHTFFSQRVVITFVPKKVLQTFGLYIAGSTTSYTHTHTHTGMNAMNHTTTQSGIELKALFSEKRKHTVNLSQMWV